MRVVMKFGGTSLADGKAAKKALEIIHEYLQKGWSLVVVVSALSQVTDRLIEASEAALRRDLATVRAICQELKRRHEKFLEDIIEDPNRKVEISRFVQERMEELEKVLVGIGYLGELTPRSRDYVLSFGERLVAPIIAAALCNLGFRAKAFTGGEAGIITDSNFGEARPLMEMTKLHVRQRLEPELEAGIVPVVTGFIATDQNGYITTLGRGGSDYTATILGVSLKADEVWLWTDVDGLMTTDPKVEPLARTIPQLSFQEAVEMAALGAKRMHPRALEPTSEAGIPVRIKNTFRRDFEGTLITGEARVRPGSIVKALTLIKDVAMITVSGSGMVGTPGTAARIFDALGRNGINILMISQSSSEANISFVIPRSLLGKAVTALETSLLGGGLIKDVEAEADVCIIAAVGAGMKGTPGVAARIFKAVGDEGINVRMIAQGSSELNISFVVKESEGERAIRALHKEFRLHEGIP
ncbi:MAG: aspartate kinase [Candidatus Bathyarchaeia archaeon]